MSLSDYTSEELRLELKRRYIEHKASRAAAMAAKDICKNCIHFGTIDKNGAPAAKTGVHSWGKYCCPFAPRIHATFYNKYKFISPYGKACEHFIRQ